MPPTRLFDLFGAKTKRQDNNDSEKARWLCTVECPFHDYAVSGEKAEEPLSSNAKRLAAHETRAEGLYTPIADWQTRILQLEPGAPEDELCAQLLVVDLIMRPGVAIHNRREHITYEALSYTWGEPLFTMSLRLNETAILPVTANLHSALKHLRLAAEHRYLWVDYICINQEDQTEKAAQISNMLDIYRKSQSVIAWLGEPDDPTAPYVEHISKKVIRRGDPWKLTQSCCNAHIPSFQQGLRGLFEQPYYSRVWIRQELWAAAQVVFVHGNVEFSWEALLWAARAADILWERQRQYDVGPTEHRLNSLRGRLEPGVKGPLMTILESSSGSQCSDLRDHVYGVLGMSSATETLSVDYSLSAAEVYMQVAEYLVNTLGLDHVLTLRGQYGAMSERSTPSLPSWCPDWAHGFQIEPGLEEFRRPPVSCFRYKRSLAVAGVHIATVTSLSVGTKSANVGVRVVKRVRWGKVAPWGLRKAPRTSGGAECHGRNVQIGDMVVMVSRARKYTIVESYGDGAIQRDVYRAVKYILREVSFKHYIYVGWTTWPPDTFCDWDDTKQNMQVFEID